MRGVWLLQVAMHSQLPHFLDFFKQSTIFSSGAEDAHQIYTRGSVLGEALKPNLERPTRLNSTELN